MDPKILNHIAHHLGIFKKLFKSDQIYVAGGALRDLDHDKPINDIDIFVPISINAQVLAVQAKLAKKAETRHLSYVADIEAIYRAKCKSLHQSYMNAWPSGMALYNVEEFDHKPYKIQVILYDHPGRKGPRALLNHFDIGLCQISYDGDRVHRTDAYKKDRDERTLTIEPAFRGSQRTLKRIEKLKEKYGYTPTQPAPVVPPTPLYGEFTLDDLLSVTNSTSTTYAYR